MFKTDMDNKKAVLHKQFYVRLKDNHNLYPIIIYI